MEGEMEHSNLHSSANGVHTVAKRATAFAVLGLLVCTLPIGAGSTGQTRLYMPQGADAGTANGDYVMATTGLNTYYSYFVEVPPSLSRLVVEIFDADVGAGGAGEVAAQRDRDRGGAYDSTFDYSLLNPSGTVVATADETSGGDNAWYTIYDSNTAGSPTAPTWQATTTNTKTDNNVTTFQLTAPATVNPNDLLVAIVSEGDSGGTISAPGGWTTLNVGECAGGSGCQVGVFWRIAVGTEDGTVYNFTNGNGDETVGAILRYSGVDTANPFNPAAATTNTGNDASAEANAITTTVTNVVVVRVYTAADNVTASVPGGTNDRVSLTQDDGGNGVVLRVVDATQAVAGGSGALTSTLGSAEDWRTLTFGLRGNPGALAPANGHWEIRVDSTGGDDLNAIGIRAHDGTSGAGGTELPVYYDSHTQFGVNPVADPTIRDYDVFPWVTYGCQGVISTFDFDANNGGSQGSIDLTSPANLGAGGTAYTQTVADAALSGNDVWVRNTFGPWSTDFRSTRYGIWRADVQIRTYTTPALNGNYTNMYLAPSTQPADPPGQPEVGVYRVYLPTDTSDTSMPVKPYIEQLVTWVSGPNPPSVGVQTIAAVTIRVVNPTLQAITFSTPNNIVTANIPGTGATYGGSPQVSQGSVVSQPGVGGTGNITWNPGTVAAGNGDATIDDAEVEILTYLVRVTPTSAGQRVVVTGTPASNGTRAQYVDETGNTTQARATYLGGPLCELALTQGLTTKALVTEFRALEERGQVAVEWATTTEDGTTGFDLYRWNAAEDDWDRVNGDLVMAAPDSVTGARYRVIDPAAPLGAESTYALMELEGKGTSRTAATFTVLPEAAGKASLIFSGDLMSERRALAPTSASIARLSAARARASEAEALQLDLLRSTVRPQGTDARLRIRIQEAGLYRLTATDLASRFGVPVETAARWISTGQLRLENRGQVVPSFRPRADAMAIFFYARSADSIYTRDNVYWLSVASGAAMDSITVAGAASGAQTFFDRQRFETDDFAATVVATDPEADYWFWEYLVGDSATDGARSFDLTLVDPVDGGDAELTVNLHGATDTGVADEHQAEIRVNGTTVGQTSWQGIAAHSSTFPFPASLLVAGSNTVEVLATVGNGAPYSVYYVDGFEVASPRLLQAENSRLEFDAGTTEALRVSGFRGGDLVLFDITDPDAPRRAFGGRLARDVSGFGLTFHPSSPESRYLAESLAAVRRPVSMEIDTPSDLRGSPGAQYLVVTDDELAAEAAALASYRAGQGLSTLVVRMQDIYDEFDFGMGGPLAVRDFLAHAWNEWPTPPRYVTFAGEGTYDYRNLSGLGGNKIPALMVATPDGLFSSDASYGDVDDDGVMEMAVGRLPVLSPAELAGVVAKTRAYESLRGDWVDEAVFIADNIDGATNFAAESDQLEGALVADFDVSKVYLDASTPTAAHDAVVAAFADGANYVQFIGHGGLDRFADESLLTNSDVAGLSNGGRAPVLAALTCAVNRFELPDYPALGEELVRSAAGGAAAVYAPSGLAQHGAAREFAQRLAAALYRPETPRLGDALVAAQQAYAGAGGSLDLLRIYNLLGDAALQLRAPTPVPPVPGPPSGE
jgi:hypothetical protein